MPRSIFIFFLIYLHQISRVQLYQFQKYRVVAQARAARAPNSDPVVHENCRYPLRNLEWCRCNSIVGVAITQRVYGYLFHDLLLRSYLYYCVWSVITAHNLTPEKRDNNYSPTL